MKFKIINLVKETHNKAIVIYDANNDKITDVFRKLVKYINDNPDSDLAQNIKSNDAGAKIIDLNMPTIDILVDDSWWSDKDLEKVLIEEEIIR